MRIIRWLLRASFYGFFLSPLIGWLAIYGFIALAMITMGTTDIWSTDPKDTPLGELVYDIALMFPVWGMLLSIPLLLFSTGFFIARRFVPEVKEIQLLPMWVCIGCFVGSLLFTVFLIWDIGHYQFWFFD